MTKKKLKKKYKKLKREVKGLRGRVQRLMSKPFINAIQPFDAREIKII